MIDERCCMIGVRWYVIHDRCLMMNDTREMILGRWLWFGVTSTNLRPGKSQDIRIGWTVLTNCWHVFRHMMSEMRFVRMFYKSWTSVLQNSTPGGVGVPLPKTFSQIGVSRDQILINFCFKMSICANSLWSSCNSGINIEAHSLGSQQLPDHIPMRLPIEADLDPFKT